MEYFINKNSSAQFYEFIYSLIWYAKGKSTPNFKNLKP